MILFIYKIIRPHVSSQFLTLQSSTINVVCFGWTKVSSELDAR